MLKGRFGDTTRRPYIEGRVIIPRLQCRANISFIVDTGADQTLLMPIDGIRIGIDYRQLTGEKETVGIGGITNNFTERGILVFAEPKRRLHFYAIELAIAPPAPDIMDIPSLLGRDILNNWQMVYNAQNSRLTFKVLSADHTELVPARSRAKPRKA